MALPSLRFAKTDRGQTASCPSLTYCAGQRLPWLTGICRSPVRGSFSFFVSLHLSGFIPNMLENVSNPRLDSLELALLAWLLSEF